MLPENDTPRLIWLLVAGWLSYGATAVSGQSEEREEKTDLFELSPFTVEADEDLGYLAASTLSGTRLRTELGDIGAALDVLTLEFLDDIGTVTIDEAFLYTAHVENAFETGQDSINGPGEGSSELRAGRGSRAMGLTAPTQSLNYFPALLPLDRYNTERIEIARGPQAILFGLGSPSGVVNTNLKRAEFHDSCLEVQTRIDNWDSRRWEVEVNQVIIDETLALRLAYLDDRQQFWMDPGWDDRIRRYGTLTWKPLDKLTFRFHHETLQRDANVPGTQLPRDYLSYFFVANGGQLVDQWDPSWLWPFPTGSYLIFNDENSTRPVFEPMQGLLFIRRAGEIIENVSDPQSEYYDPADPFFNPEWTAIDDAQYTQTLTDDTYYPVLDKYIWGEMTPTWQKGDNTTAFMELKLFKELSIFSDGFLELAYNEAQIEQKRGGVFGGNDFALSVDPNRFLPDGDLNPNAGKFLVGSFSPTLWGSLDRQEELRLTASTVMDLTDRSPWLGFHRFGFLFANRESEYNSQGANRYIGNIGGVIGGIKPEEYTGVSMAGTGTDWSAIGARRSLFSFYYLEPKKGLFYPTRDMNPWGDPLETWYVPTEDGAFGIYTLDPEGPGAWAAPDAIMLQIDSASFSWQGWFDIGEIAELVTTVGYREDRGKGRPRRSPGSYTNQFGETFTVESTGQIRETRLYAHYTRMPWEDWGEPGTVCNDVIAGVLSFDPLMDTLFGGRFRASLNFNRSTNNTGISTEQDVYGNLHPGQRGEGNNYGVRLEFDDSKIILSLNKWTVDLLGAEYWGPASRLVYPLSDIEKRWLSVEPDILPYVVSATGGYLTDPNGVDLGHKDPNSFGVYGDQLAEGWTLDLVANPLRGLRVRANLSKTEAVQSNVAEGWIDFLREIRQPLWANEIQWWDDSDRDGIYRPVLAWDPGLQLDADANGIPDTIEDGDYFPNITLGDPDNPADVAAMLSGWDKIMMQPDEFWVPDAETIKDYYLRVLEGKRLLVAESLDGLSNPTIRKWRFNLTATYTFQEGLLEDFSFGGSVRYRDKQFIGAEARFTELTLTDGSTLTVPTDDPTKPLYGQDFWFFDLMIGYEGALSLGDRPIDYAIQVNVRNLFNEDSTYATAATSNGRPVRVSRNIPREVLLSTTVRF